MKRTRIALIALGVSTLTAGAQVSWNLNVGSEGTNFNIGTTPAYIITAPPTLYAVPVQTRYYAPSHKHYKQIKKARKHYQKELRKAYKKGYYVPALYTPAYQKHHKPAKHHKHHKH